MTKRELIEVGNWDLEVFLSECAGYYPIQTLAKQTTTAQGVEIVYLSLDEDSQR